MKIKAALAEQHGAPLRIAALDLAEPGPGEILVRLVASGVCGRDLAAIAAGSTVSLPFVPGSAAAGIVERVGEGVVAPAAGDAVLVLPSSTERPAGGDQPAPLAGPAGPIHRFLGQSSFATHLTCLASDAVALDPNAPLELAAALPGEVLAGAAPMLDLADDTAAVLITGAGAAGLAACMAASARGIAAIIVADASETACRLALDAGATITVPGADGLAAAVRSLKPDGVPFAIETTGAAAWRDAVRKSVSGDGRCINFGRDVNDAGSGALVAKLLALHAAGRLPIEPLVTFFPFERVNDALEALATGAVPKPILRFPVGPFDALDRALVEGAAVDEAGAGSEPTVNDDQPVAPAADPVTA